MSSSIFAVVEMAPRDPILGLTEAFDADARPTKANLGVGVYYDDAGKIPLLAAVKAAVSLNDDGLRPLARGPAIRVGRAYGAEDEDCTLVIKPSTDERGRVRYMRSVTCAN